MLMQKVQKLHGTKLVTKWQEILLMENGFQDQSEPLRRKARLVVKGFMQKHL